MAATISEHIKNDLIKRIEGEQWPPPDLTITALAQHYRVSFTPVQQALRDLVSEGVLEKGENRHVRIKPKAGANGSVAVEPPALPPDRPAEIEAALAADVIAKSLRRQTDYLREDPTAARFGVSRTVIRHALARLAGRGLIVQLPRRGWRVRAFDDADLDAYLEIREMLELKALELAKHHLVEADLLRMLAGNEPGRKGHEPRLDNNLHDYIINKAGNRYIRDFFDRHGPYFTTLFDFAAPETHVTATMARQHRAILQALIDRDWARAAEALAKHIRDQRPIVKDLMQRFGRARPEER